MELGSKQIDLGVWGITDTGRMRTGNQDTFLALELASPPSSESTRVGPDLSRTDSEGLRRLPLGPRGALLLVADGMGGAAGGEVASRLAIESVVEAMERIWQSEESDAGLDQFSRRLRDAIVEAHARIQAYASDRPWLQGMGTTITAAGVLDGTIVLGQVGDSRAYLLRGERLTQISRDQTWVQEMVESGAMTPEEARASPRRSLLLQALGATSGLMVPVTSQTLRPGDVLLLCSDGLSGVLGDDEIADVLLRAATLREACERLVWEANEAGGPDNITVLLAEPHARG